MGQSMSTALMPWWDCSGKGRSQQLGYIVLYASNSGHIGSSYLCRSGRVIRSHNEVCTWHAVVVQHFVLRDEVCMMFI